MIDEVDAEILQILQSDGRMPNADLARALDRAPSFVLDRVRKLERKGLIERYEAILKPKDIGFTITAFTFVKADESAGAMAIGEALAEVPNVLEVHYTAGRDSYLVKVRARDPEHLQHTLQAFGGIPGVRDTYSTVVLTTIKETRALPLQISEPAEPDAHSEGSHS